MFAPCFAAERTFDRACSRFFVLSEPAYSYQLILQDLRNIYLLNSPLASWTRASFTGFFSIFDIVDWFLCVLLEMLSGLVKFCKLRNTPNIISWLMLEYLEHLFMDCRHFNMWGMLGRCVVQQLSSLHRYFFQSNFHIISRYYMNASYSAHGSRKEQ